MNETTAISLSRPSFIIMHSFRYLLVLLGMHQMLQAVEVCRIEIVDQENGWPVPLVELRSTHQYRFVSDNRGLIAMDAPEMLDREVYFEIEGHGYEVPKDGFGYRGVRLNPKARGSMRIELHRRFAAKRLGRLTGGGLFAESQKLGLDLDWKESGLFGCDSVQSAVYEGKRFWAWGDTLLPRYPLGLFHMTGATTALNPIDTFEPPIRPAFDYFKDDHGNIRVIAKMPGGGPTWLSGMTTIEDQKGEKKLVGHYHKITPPLESHESGLAVWSDATQNFTPLKVLWSKGSGAPKPMLQPEGNPIRWTDAQGAKWLMFGNPFPDFRCPESFESWSDPSTWEKLETSKKLKAVGEQEEVEAHSGSIAWSSYRKKWIAIFVERFGKPSLLGEVWYAEANQPMGPWGMAVKILSHNNYTFYNPRLHVDLAPDGAPFVLFEGTYTATFANNPQVTPRYDYNQVLYRVDLDDPRLKPAQE